MKVLYIAVLRTRPAPAIELAAESDLTSFSRFTRGNVAEYMVFASKTVAERTSAGQRLSVHEQSYMVHSYARSEGVCGVLISDEEYPARTAHGCLSKILDEFLTQNPISSFDSLPAGSKLPFAPLREYITKYQDPQNADSILKIQAELDATKIEMRKAIDSVLERGENLEQLVTKSNDLNSSSKAFYKQAKKQNSCCVVM